MTTSTLRPNSTGSNPDSITGAATGHEATNDDSDATYWTDNDVVTLGFGTVALPAGAVTKQIRYRWRGRGDTVTTGSVIDIRSTGNQLQTVNGSYSTTLTTRSGVYVPVTLTQTLIDNLELRFDQGVAGGNSLRVYEAYLDLVYVTIPVTVVTAVSPDPYTASTLVPIEWTNTLDSDGGAQTRYEIKVFTDAQYGAGDFDPDTSTPYYTSGEVVSAVDTADVGPLENSDTYRAYVRVAQTVNGQPHWSDWAYDQFTMSLTTSDVATVSAVATNASGLITVTVEWDALSTGWEYIEVQRTIDGGTTWTDVRGATYVATADSGATDFTVVDYEVPNGVAVDYRARATYLSAGLPVTGSWVETASSTTWTSDDSWLKDVSDPTLNTTFCMSARTPYRRTRRAGVFQVLGKAAPVTIVDVRSKRSGEMIVETETAQEAEDLAAILDGAQTILVQHPLGMDIADMYIVVTSDEETFRSVVADSVWREWSLSYVEVDVPADPDAGR